MQLVYKSLFRLTFKSSTLQYIIVVGLKEIYLAGKQLQGGVVDLKYDCVIYTNNVVKILFSVIKIEMHDF